MNKIILLAGKSGSGKTAIAKILATKYGLSQIQSYTTRPQRNNDECGHIFVAEEEFDFITEVEPIAAYTSYNGYEYCATGRQVDANDIYVIDPKGIEYFKEKYKGNKNSFVVYINSDESIRIKRMKERGDTEKQILKRIKTDEREFQNFEEKADYIIENSKDSNLDVLARKIWLEYIE